MIFASRSQHFFSNWGALQIPIPIFIEVEYCFPDWSRPWLTRVSCSLRLLTIDFLFASNPPGRARRWPFERTRGWRGLGRRRRRRRRGRRRPGRGRRSRGRWRWRPAASSCQGSSRRTGARVATSHLRTWPVTWITTETLRRSPWLIGLARLLKMHSSNVTFTWRHLHLS